MGARLRRAALGFASFAMSPLLFRLSAGRWPDRQENRQFAAALGDNSLQIPAIPRALIAVTAARHQAANMISLYLIAQGSLPKTAEGGISPFFGNPLHFWRGPSVGFLHFERTGGTSLAAALTDKFHPLQIGGTHGIDDSLHPNAPPGAAPADLISDCKLVWGHYDLPALHRLGEGRRLITILREPVARILSLYYFWRSIHPAQLADMSDSRVVRAQQLDLLGFLQSDHQPIRDSIDNVYVRRLTGLYGGATTHDPLERDPENAMNRARESLDRFAFIGISENMADTFLGIEAVLGIKLGESRRLNDIAANSINEPSLYRPVEREVVTPEITAALLHYTRLDRIIYEACKGGKKDVLF